MNSNKQTLARIVMSALLTLYLGVSCLIGPPGPAASVTEAFAVGRADAGSSVGIVGSTLNALAAWVWGPWLRWLVLLLPWAWVPFSKTSGKKKSGSGRRWTRWATAAVAVIALCGSLAHPALSRLGIPTRAGGALGAWVQEVVAGPLGSVGSFLVLTALWVFLLIHFLPPIRLELAFLDTWQEHLISFLARVRDGLSSIGRGIGRAVTALGAWLRDRLAGLKLPALGRSKGAEDAGPGSAGILGVAGMGFDGGRGVPGARSASVRVGDEPAAPQGVSGGPAAASEEDYDEGDEYEEYEEYEYEDEEDGTGEAAEPDGESWEEEWAAGEAGLTAAEMAEGAQGQFQLSRDPAELLRSEKLAAGRKGRRRRGTLPPPSLDVLEDVEKEERGFSREVLEMNARLLLETLSSFGVEGRISEIRPGPVVTTFEFEPGVGVKVSQITSRADDLALAMRAIRIRIVAPIPGKAAVGIEVPNPYPQMVTLKEVVAPLTADERVTPLSIALGKDTEGNPVAADLADMPHLLVAGATGSGKSVCLNALICSLLLRNGPDRLRLLMIDPKMLELSLYNGIPHLMHPVITDHKEALKALKIMVAEMTTRYNLLARYGVRNVLDYNLKVKAGKIRDEAGHKVVETMPYIVVIVDELADLMMLLGSELETPIARLAQMARAVGIHLVLATQRPSVNVITGVIKANFPSRIGFRVISKVDSRTILDVMGAEQLLGKGDSLFLMAGMTQPTRVHGAYLSTEECEAISEYWQGHAGEQSRLPLEDVSEGGSALDLGEDDLLDDAKRIVVLAQQGSTSMLQRKLRVGYTRAARLMDMLEETGVVGPFEGSKAREVLVKPEELEAGR